jgi:hypothetical protein
MGSRQGGQSLDSGGVTVPILVSVGMGFQRRFGNVIEIITFLLDALSDGFPNPL